MKILTANIGILPVLLLFAACIHTGHAQILQAGQDPADIEWNFIRTPSYRFIYPAGYDSVAVKYAEMYERYRIPVCMSTGFSPARLPVVLHPENASASYDLTMLPSRIDMPLLPQGQAVFSYPVTELAAVYTSRRAVHLSYGSSNVFRPFTWFFGELIPVAATAAYPEQWMLKGDAVMASSSLIPGGYGRYGDFLNYYAAAMDAGDTRGYKWDRWAIGSTKHYTPGTDAFGYMILRGMHTLYHADGYVADYLSYSSRRPYDIFVSRHISKRHTGGSLHREIFKTILDSCSADFSREKAARAPFTVSEKILPETNSGYVEYGSSAVLPDGTLYAVRKSLDRSACLVRISPSGNIERVSGFTSGTASRLIWSESLQRLFWSETTSDRRWKQRKTNDIRYYDARTGNTKSLTGGDNLFNPALSPDGTMIAAVCGNRPDETSIAIVDGESGKTVRTLPAAPEGVLFTECAWSGDRIFAAGVSVHGSAIYTADLTEEGAVPGNDGTGSDKSRHEWKTVIGPARHTIRNIGFRKDSLVFAGDADGVFDLYQLCLPASENISGQNPVADSGTRLVKLTSTEYGAKDFTFDATGDTLYFSRLDHLGYDLRRAGTASLLRKEIPAASLSAEKRTCPDSLSIGKSRNKTETKDVQDIIVSGPKKYRKALHLFRPHSWAPVYCNLERLSSLSGEKFYDLVSVGATVLSQNTLGTAFGSAGYCWRPDPDGHGRVHGGHLNFTYAGWYPVIEGSFYINDRISWNYALSPEGRPVRTESPGPSLAGKIDIYVPLSKETGGLDWSFVPVLSWELDNSRYSGALNHRVTLSGRFWLLRDKAKAEIYPKYGIGVEAGLGMALPGRRTDGQHVKLSDTWYFHSYGYFPGICPGQGGKLSLTTQMQLSRGIYNPASEILPRGLTGSITRTLYNPSFSTLLTFDYVIPVYLGDINISPLFYLNRLIITPHFDYGFSAHPKLHLCSAGSSLTFELGRFFFTFPFEIGLDYSYNFGSIFSIMKESSGSKVLRHSLRPVIKVKF